MTLLKVLKALLLLLLLLLKIAGNGAVAATIKALLHLKWYCSCC